MAPERGAARGLNPERANNMVATTEVHPSYQWVREHVSTLDIVRLAELLAGPLDTCGRDGSSFYFPCPTCGPDRACRPGPAYVSSEWVWSCHECRHRGTRFELEALVLASPAALESLGVIG